MLYVRIWWKGRIHDYIRTGLTNVDLLGEYGIRNGETKSEMRGTHTDNLTHVAF